MNVEEIASGVYVSSFYPGINVGLIVTDGGAVAVDAPPLPADAQSWREWILATTGGPIRYVLLTDPHPDRLVGVGWLGAPVIAGGFVFRQLREGGESWWHSLLEEWAQNQPGGVEIEPAPQVLPEIIVNGSVTLHSTVPVVVELVAGATPGSIWVRLPQQAVVFAGDTVVVGRHPLLSAAPDTRAWLETLVELRRSRSPVRLIVPGRGPLARKEDTRELSEYIQRVRRRVRAVRTAGGRRSDLARLVPEFLSLFPVEKSLQERAWREVQAGLERVFEELAQEEKA